MSVVDLYTGIYQTLSRDSIILSYLGLDETSTEINRIKKVQKRSKPQNIVASLPLIAYYSPGGQRDIENIMVHTPTFIFDIYTKDDVELAQLIASRIFDIFVDEFPEFGVIETFKVLYVDEYESNSNLANTYCYTVVLNFPIALPK